MNSDFYILVGIVIAGLIYSKKDIFINLLNKNIYISNTNLLFKRAKECLLDKNVSKKGNKIYIYEINSLKRQGKLIKTIEINKIPLKFKTKTNIKYGKVPNKIEIQQDLKQ